MAKRSNNNSAGRRPHGQQPYDPNNSFVKKMASKVGEMIPQKSWISKWFNSPSSNGAVLSNQDCDDDQDIADEKILQPPTKRPRIRMDVTHPPGTFSIQPRNPQTRPYDKQHNDNDNNDDDDNDDEDVDDNKISGKLHDESLKSTAGTSTSSHSFVSSTPANLLLSSRPMLSQHYKSNGRANGTDGNSESGESTSGCSSLIPQINRRDSIDRQNYMNLAFPTKKTIIDNKLNSFTNNVQSPRSLFLDSVTKDSMSNRRPSFSLTMMNNNNNNNDSASTSEFDTSSVLSSPFYNGNTTFGGANAIERSRKSLASVPGVSQFQLKIPRRSSVQVKPSNVSTTDLSGMSQTAKRIFEALENFSSPISDAKKIPIKTSGNFSNTKKRGRDEAFDTTTTTRRVGLRHLTRELAVPTVPEMLKLKRRQRLQDTTLAARKLISANSTQPLPMSSTTTPSHVENQEYHLRSDDNDGSKFLGKIRTKTKSTLKTSSGSNSSSNISNIIQMPMEQINLPNIALPITNLPTFDIALPKPSNNKFSMNSDDSNSQSPTKLRKIESVNFSSSPSASTSKNDVNFEFSSPIRLDNNIRRSLQPINDFTFSSPINANSTKQNETNTFEFTSTVASSSTSATMNFTWSSSSTAPRPKTNQSPNNQNSKKNIIDLKSSSGIDIFGNNNCLKNNERNLWECSECFIKNNDNVDACIACKTSREKSSLNKKNAGDSILQTSNAVGNKINENTKFGDSFKMSNDSSSTEKKDEKMKKVDEEKAAVSSLPVQEDTIFGKGKNDGATLDKFLPAKDSWECPGCMLQNPGNVIACPCCNASKPGLMKATSTKTPETSDEKSKSLFSSSNTVAPLPAISSSSGFGDKFKIPAGSWSCDVCMVQNKSDVVECIACGGLKPGATPASQPTASDSLPKFSFGIPSTAAAAAATTESIKTDNSTSLFKFGVPTDTSAAATPSQSFTFGIPSAPAPETTKSQETSGFTFAAPKKIDNLKSEDKETASTQSQPIGFTFNTPTEVKKVEQVQQEKTISSEASIATTTTSSTSFFSSPVVKTTLANEQKSNNILSFGQSDTKTIAPVADEKDKKVSFSFKAPTSITSPSIFGEKASVEVSKPSPVIGFGSTLSTTTPSPALGASITFGSGNKVASFGDSSKVSITTSGSTETAEVKPLFKAATGTFGSSAMTAASTATTTSTSTSSGFGSWPASTPLFGSSTGTAGTTSTTQSATSGVSIFGNPSSVESSANKTPAPTPTPTPGIFTFGSTANQQNKPAASTTGFSFNTPTTASSGGSGFGSFAPPVQSQNSSTNFTFGSNHSTTQNQPPASNQSSSFLFNSTSNTPNLQSEKKPSLPSSASTGFGGFGGFASTTPNVNSTTPATPSFAFNAPKPSATPSFGQSSVVPNVFGSSQTPASTQGSFSTLTPSSAAGFNFSASTPPVQNATATPTSSSVAGGFNFAVGAPSTGGFNFAAPAPQAVSFDPTSRPSFNFTGGSAPTVFAATPQAAASQGPRKIKKAVRRIPSRT